MSHDYTFISDLNNGGGMPMQASPMQGGPMNHQQAYPDPSQMSGGMPMQGMPMQGMPMQGGGMPMQGGPDQFDMLRKYLAESADDSDSDSDSDSDDEGDSGGGNWQHYYGIATLIMLAIILYYVFKIRRELTGMYEEA
jgi:hypothetical protein